MNISLTFLVIAEPLPGAGTAVSAAQDALPDQTLYLLKYFVKLAKSHGLWNSKNGIITS